MTDRTCTICTKIFKYPSKLHRHLESKKCKAKIITNIIDTVETIDTNDTNDTSELDELDELDELESVADSIDDSVDDVSTIVTNATNATNATPTPITTPTSIANSNIVVKKRAPRVYKNKSKNNAVPEALPVNTAIAITTEVPVNNDTIDECDDRTCLYCNKKFSTKYKLKYHVDKYKCSNMTPIDIENVVLKKQNDKLINIISKTSNIEIIPITNNNTNNIINNQNNLTINNNTIIQHIHPFGFEDIRKLDKSEMLKILKSGINSGILIIKAIYSKIENKNFYKPNMSKSDIACLNNEYDLTIYKGNQFSDALFDRCISLLHHMLYLCKKDLSFKDIQLIYDNIEYIEGSMRTEIYDKKLKNIIESEVRNNNTDNKNRISKYVKQIKSNHDVTLDAKLLVDTVKELKKIVYKDFDISIKDEDFNKKLGDPDEYMDLIKADTIDEFQMKSYEYTQFYKYWKNRITSEKEYVESKDNISLGDILNIKKRETMINNKIDVVGIRHNELEGGIIDINV